MPGHKIHDTVTIVTTAALAVPAWWVNYHMLGPVTGAAVTWGVIIGGLSNLYLTPDLDQAEGWGCYSFHRMRKLNPLLGAIWQGYWYKYGKMCKHRGLSHTPIVGTLGRVLYGLPWLLPLVLIAFLWWPFAAAWLVGLMWADLWHTIMDGLDKALGGRL